MLNVATVGRGMKNSKCDSEYKRDIKLKDQFWISGLNF